MRNYLIALGVGTLLVGAGLYDIWQPDAVANVSTHTAAHASTTPTAPAITLTYAATGEHLRTQLQSTSLAGLDVPHTLHVDATGQLQPDAGLRALMEFFLALDGEMPPAQLRGLFAEAAAAQCSPACAAAALQHFDRYRDYLAAMAEQQSQLLETDDLRARLEHVMSLRRSLLGDVLAEAFFGYEEQYDRLRVAQWEIHHNPALSEAQKQQRLQLLAEEQPPDLAERERPMRLLEQARTLQQQFDGEEDADALQAARAELLGDAAAQRLRELDQQRAAWDERYARYRQERAQLETAGLDADARQLQIEQLRQHYFSGQESTRVAALDRINGDSIY